MGKIMNQFFIISASYFLGVISYHAVMLFKKGTPKGFGHPKALTEAVIDFSQPEIKKAFGKKDRITPKVRDDREAARRERGEIG
jgi:hypothetical protein